MIPPSVGRVLWFHPHPSAAWHGYTLACIVTAVHDDRCVNLVVFDPNGNSFGVAYAQLCQPGDQPKDTGNGGWCEWMPYQLGQAERTIAAERAAGEAPA